MVRYFDKDYTEEEEIYSSPTDEFFSAPENQVYINRPSGKAAPAAPAEATDQNVETLNLVVELGESSLSKIDQIFRMFKLDKTETRLDYFRNEGR